MKSQEALMMMKIQIRNGREWEQKSKVDDSYGQCTFPNRQIIEVRPG